MRFRPSVVGTLTALFVCGTCIRLGFWQLSRYDTRSAEAERRHARHALPALTEVAAPFDDLDYRRVELSGRYTHALVVTGGIPFSRNGYAALAVFQPHQGSPVLVNRGWVPSTSWQHHLVVPEGAATLTGILRRFPKAPPVEPLPDGRWPLEREAFIGGLLERGVTIPYHSISTHYALTSPVAVVLGPELDDLENRKTRTLPAGGYTTYLKVFHHLEYALQWFTFAGIAALLWLGFGVRRGRQT